MISQLWVCPALIVPVASDEPGTVCTQFTVKIGVLNPAASYCGKVSGDFCHNTSVPFG